MMKTRGLCFGVGLLLGIAFLFGSLPVSGAQEDAAGEEADRRQYLQTVYAREAVSLLYRENYEAALVKFMVLTEAFPDQAVYWDFRAQCHNGVSEYEQAWAAADIAVTLEPFVEKHYLPRAKAAYHLNRFEEAIPDLERFLSAYSMRASAWMMLGLCRLRTGRLDDAEEAVQRAKTLSPYLADYADYQLGVIALERGEKDRGTALLQKTRTRVEGTPFADTIQRQIEAGEAEPRPGIAARPWYAGVTAGVEHTNNVLSLSKDSLLPADISSRRDENLFLLIQGGYRLHQDPRHTLWITGVVYGNHYFTLDDFDVQQYTPRLDYTYRPAEDWRLRSLASYTHYRVDEETSSNAFAFTQEVVRLWDDDLSTTLDYTVAFNAFSGDTTPDEDRDGNHHTIRGYQTFRFQPFGLVLDAGARYGWNNTDGSEFDAESYGLFVSLSHDFFWDTRLRFDFSYSRTDYDNDSARADPAFSDAREDDAYAPTVTWSKAFTPHWSAAFVASYYDNDSNIEVYDFDKVTLSTSVTYRF